MALHPLVDGSLLASVGPLVLRVDERGELVHDPKMLRGIKSIRGVSAEDDEFEGVAKWWPISLGGRWPDAVYLSLDVASGFRGEGGEPEVLRWDGQAWVKIETRSRNTHWYPAEVHPWIEGSLLARRAYVPWYGEEDPWEDGDGPSAATVAAADRVITKAKKIVVIRGKPKAPAVPATVTAFDSLETGELFVVTGEDPPSMVRIDAAGASHTVALPGTDVHVHGVVADGTDRAWVFGMMQGPKEDGPWLVRVEGDRATATDAPACTQIGLASVVVLESGAMWATCADPLAEPEPYGADAATLWYRAPNGAWTPSTLPPGISGPRRVVARNDGDVWVAAEHSGGGVILHSRPRASVLELPDLPELGRQAVEWNDPLPIDGCPYPYIPLRSPPADAATVKAALDGPLTALTLEVPVVLARTTVRGTLELGLQLMGSDGRRDVQQVAAAASKALGKEALDPPRCWYARDIEAGEIGMWGLSP